MTKTNPVYSANLFKMGSFRRESYSYRIYKLQFIPNKKNNNKSHLLTDSSQLDHPHSQVSSLLRLKCSWMRMIQSPVGSTGQLLRLQLLLQTVCSLSARSSLFFPVTVAFFNWKLAFWKIRWQYEKSRLFWENLSLKLQ